VAQFAPAVLGGMYWKGGTREGALAGLLAGFALWAYTLMLPSIAKSGWLADRLHAARAPGAWPGCARAAARPERPGQPDPFAVLEPAGQRGAYVGVSLWRAPTARGQPGAAVRRRVRAHPPARRPVFWRGRAEVADLLALAERFLGAATARRRCSRTMRAQRAWPRSPRRIEPDAQLVQFVETQLAGAIGSASARVMVASVVQEEERWAWTTCCASWTRPRSCAPTRRAGGEVASLERPPPSCAPPTSSCKSLDRLKDDFMSAVTHELRTPLTSIRALAELMRDDPDMPTPQRQQFLGIIVAETERLSRLVNQVLDMAKIESGHAEWHNADIDLAAAAEQAVQTTAEMFRERGARCSWICPSRGSRRCCAPTPTG
jgi:signal transduction histidine kinase